jgi:hypothetical protein
MTTDPLGSFRDQLVDGVRGEARRRRRRRAIAGGMAAAMAVGVGAVAVAAGGSDDQQVTAEGSTTITTTTAQPDECPATRPPEPGLDPPAPWSAPPPDQVWFGTADLWTALPDGTSPVPRKSVWWSRNFPGGAEEEQPEVSVTWRRLDDPSAPVVRAEPPGTNAYTPGTGWFMIASKLDPVGIGCWEVTGSYKGHELTYVYEVRPRLWVSDVEGGELALIQGVVRFDPLANCFFVGDAPVVWPPGTTLSDDGAELTLSDGTTIGVGDRIRSAGGFAGGEAAPRFAIPESCLNTPVNIAFLNLTQPIEVTR